MQTIEAFANRYEAGRRLAKRLQRFAGRGDVVVLALPRGGVPVASEVARVLGVPFDVFAVRKLGVPGHEEFAMGAIGSGGARVLNYDVIDALHISHAAIARVVEREQDELQRRERAYRDGRTFPDLAGKTVIVIDDGVATGSSMLAAVSALRERDPARIVVAVPVGSEDACTLLSRYADEVVCDLTPRAFGGVGAWYTDFSQVGDDEVRRLLGLQAAPARAE